MVRAYLSKLSSKQRIVFVALDGIQYGPIKSAGSSHPFGFNEGDMPSLSASPGVGGSAKDLQRNEEKTFRSSSSGM